MDITLIKYLTWLCDQREKELKEKERAERENRKAGELLRKKGKN